jgi:hypothetical protein
MLAWAPHSSQGPIRSFSISASMTRMESRRGVQGFGHGPGIGGYRSEVCRGRPRRPGTLPRNKRKPPSSSFPRESFISAVVRGRDGIFLCVEEVKELFGFLAGLYQALDQLYLNGRRPAVPRRGRHAPAHQHHLFRVAGGGHWPK